MDGAIDVSFVMTVFNKERYLPAVLEALLGQTGLKNPEFIFVDDASSDASVEIIRRATAGIPNVTILANERNLGISRTTNIALKLARGKYVRPLDSDDILPLNSTEKMAALAEAHGADMVYGTFVKTGKKAEELAHSKIADMPYAFYPDALDAVLRGRFIRMGQLLRNDLVHKAKGADERVFIQDQSLPLRCALHSRGGIVKAEAAAVLVPQVEGNFSGNKLQLDHDRFLAYFYAIADNPGLAAKYLDAMHAKCASAYWKMARKTWKDRGARRLAWLGRAFSLYLASRLRPRLDLSALEEMRREFAALPGVRRG